MLRWEYIIKKGNMQNGCTIVTKRIKEEQKV